MPETRVKANYNVMVRDGFTGTSAVISLAPQCWLILLVKPHEEYFVTFTAHRLRPLVSSSCRPVESKYTGRKTAKEGDHERCCNGVIINAQCSLRRVGSGHICSSDPPNHPETHLKLIVSNGGGTVFLCFGWK